MSETAFEKQIMNKLDRVERAMNEILEHISDAKLTDEERKELNASLSKIKSGDNSDFASWKAAKKELGM